MTAEVQLAELQRSVGRLEGKVDSIYEDLAATQQMIADIHVAMRAVDVRVTLLGQRNWNGGLNSRTWIAIITLVGVLGTAAASVVAAIIR